MWLPAATFVAVGTSGAGGAHDVSPRGGPAGFVKVLDERRLAIPDLNGNNRLDTLNNVIETGEIGLMFVVPGLGETLRINGRATVTVHPDVLDLFVDEATAGLDPEHTLDGAVLAARGTAPLAEVSGPVTDLRVNPELVRLSREDSRRDKLAARGSPGRRPERGRPGRSRPGSRGGASTASRAQVLERLGRRRPGVGEVAAGHGEHPGGQAERVDRREVLARLTAPALVGGDDDHHGILEAHRRLFFDRRTMSIRPRTRSWSVPIRWAVTPARRIEPVTASSRASTCARNRCWNRGSLFLSREMKCSLAILWTLIKIITRLSKDRCYRKVI